MTAATPWYISALALNIYTFIIVGIAFFFLRRATIRHRQAQGITDNYRSSVTIMTRQEYETAQQTDDEPPFYRPQPTRIATSELQTVVYTRPALLQPVAAKPEPEPMIDTCLVAHPEIPSVPHQPPHMDHVLRELDRRDKERTQYLLPIGWSWKDGIGTLESVSLRDAVNHALISGQNDSGKDNETRVGLLALCLRHPPTAIQVAIIDGKGLDWTAWKDKAHTWLLARFPSEIPSALRKLTRERERRIRLLEAAKVVRWQDYEGDDLPLLVVFVSELKLLKRGMGNNAKLEEWLAAELSVSRAAGIRYILATQTATRMGTDWRSQIALYIAGFQPMRSQDEPNCSLTTEEVVACDALPPSRIPPKHKDGSGIFCTVLGREVKNVRATLLGQEDLERYLLQLPDTTVREALPTINGDVIIGMAPLVTTPAVEEPQPEEASLDEDLGRLIRIAFAIGKLTERGITIDQRSVAEILTDTKQPVLTDTPVQTLKRSPNQPGRDDTLHTQ